MLGPGGGRHFLSAPELIAGVNEDVIKQLLLSGESSKDLGLIVTFQQAKEIDPTTVLEGCIGVTVVDNSGVTTNVNKEDLREIHNALANARGEVLCSSEDLRKCEAERSKLSREAKGIKSFSERLAVLEESQEGLRGEVAELRKSNGALTQSNEGLGGEVAELMKSNKGLRGEVAELMKSNEGLQGEVADLENRVVILESAASVLDG